jgi:hypothetical protein
VLENEWRKKDLTVDEEDDDEYNESEKLIDRQLWRKDIEISHLGGIVLFNFVV